MRSAARDEGNESLPRRARSLADRGYGVGHLTKVRAWPNIPTKHPQKPNLLQSYLYRDRNLVEGFFNKIKRCRHVATRYNKLAANNLAESAYGCALTSPRLPRTRGYVGGR